MYEFSPFGANFLPRLIPSAGKTYDFRDEFTTAKVSGDLTPDTSLCEPGPGTRTVTDAETCLSILPNVGSSLASNTGVTFGGSNNRCSYADGYGWMDFPTGFNASLHAGLGRIVVMYDSNGRAAWGWLGGAGSGESLGSELIVNADFETGIPPTSWNVSSGSTLTQVTDNRPGSLGTKCINALRGSDNWVAKQTAIVNVNNRLFKINGWAKAVSGSVYFGFYASTSYAIFTTASSSSTSWVELTHYACMTSINTLVPLLGSTAEGRFDDISIKQVTTPSATGCYIYKTLAAAQSGDTAASGWNKPTAFDMNNSNYTFNIYQPTSGGKLFFMGGKATAGSGDPGFWTTSAITRTAGQILAFKVKPTDAAKIIAIGAFDAKNGTNIGNGLIITGDTIKPLDGGTTGPTVFIPLDNTEYTLIAVLRSAGAQFFIKTASGYYKRVWSYVTNNTATLYVAVTGNTMAGEVDFIRIPRTRWLPASLLSDSFAAADATSNNNRISDGLGHLETTGLGSGGGGVVWSVVAGTSVISSNKATFSALSSGIGMAIGQTNNANVTIRCALTRSAGNIGVVLRYVDADNYVRAIHNGTNVQLIKRVAGSEVTPINQAIAYSADAEIAVRSDSTKFSVWYNNILAGSIDTEITDAAIQSSGKCGIYTSDTGATFDNINVYATGTGNEFSILDRLIGS